MLSFDDLISGQLGEDGGFSPTSKPSAVLSTLLVASSWPSRATAAAVLSNTSEAYLKSLVELPDSASTASTPSSSALFSVLKTWLSDALSASPSTAISPFGPASDATAEAVSCVLQTLLRIPVDLKRIAASKIGHLVMKLHTTGGEATSGGGGGASAISLQIQEIYKTATRVVTLWKDTKAKTAGDASAAAIDSNKSGASTKSSSSSQPAPLPLMATPSSSSKHSKSSATMVIDDDVVEASKKRPRSSSAKGNSTEDGGKGNSSSSSSSSSSTTTTSKKSKTEAANNTVTVESLSSSGNNNNTQLAPLTPLARLSSSSSSSFTTSSSSVSLSGSQSLQPSSSSSLPGVTSLPLTSSMSTDTAVGSSHHHQLSMMSTMDFSNGLGSGLGGSTSSSSSSFASSAINTNALDEDTLGPSTYLIDDALDKLDPSAIAWGIPDEDEWSQNVLRTPQGFGDIPYEKNLENDIEPGIREDEQQGLERMRGLGMPDRYGIVSGGNFDETVQRTLPRGILVNKMLMRVGGLPLRLLDPGTEEAEEVMKQGGSIIVMEGGGGGAGAQNDGAMLEDSVKIEQKPFIISDTSSSSSVVDPSKSGAVGGGASMMVIGDDDAPPGSELNSNVGVPPILNAVVSLSHSPKETPPPSDIVVKQEGDSSSSSSPSIVSTTENPTTTSATGAPVRVKVRRPIRWLDHAENAGPALASKNHFAPCSTYTLNGLVAVRFFDFLTHIVEDPKKSQQRSATTSLSSSSAASVEVVVEETSNHSSSSDSSSSAADGNGGVISFEEARKREKSREKSLLAAVGSSPSSSPKKKVQEHLYSSPHSVLMTVIPACSAKVSKGWLSPLGPPKVKATARTPFLSPEAAKIEKEMQTSAALKAQLMGQRYLGGRGGAAPLLHPFTWKDKSKIDADPELVPDGLASSAVSRSGGSGGGGGGAGGGDPSLQKVFEHIKVRWQFGLLGGIGGGVSSVNNPLYVQQKFQLQQVAQQQALQLAQQQQQLLLQQQQLQQQIQLQQQQQQQLAAAASGTVVASSTITPVDSTSSSMVMTPVPASMSMPMMFPSSNSALSSSAIPSLFLTRPVGASTSVSSTLQTLQQGGFGANAAPMMMMGIGSGVGTSSVSSGGIGKKPCMFFQSKAGCRNGARCPYLHDPQYKAPQEDFNRISAADKKSHVSQMAVVGGGGIGGAVVSGGAVPQVQQQQQIPMQTQGGWGIQQQQQPQQWTTQQPQPYMPQQQQQQQQQQPSLGWGIQPAPQQQAAQPQWGIQQQPQPQMMQMQPAQVYAPQPGVWPQQQQPQQQQMMMMMPQATWGQVMPVQQQQPQQQPQQQWNAGWGQQAQQQQPR